MAHLIGTRRRRHAERMLCALFSKAAIETWKLSTACTCFAQLLLSLQSVVHASCLGMEKQLSGKILLSEQVTKMFNRACQPLQHGRAPNSKHGTTTSNGPSFT